VAQANPLAMDVSSPSSTMHRNAIEVRREFGMTGKREDLSLS
jgi:hypothetical protein